MCLISAVCTLLAVIVALWQTKWPYRTKIKITAHIIDSMSQVDIDRFYKKKIVTIQIRNVGFTDVTLQSWGVRIGRNFIEIPSFDGKGNILSSKRTLRGYVPMELFQDPIINLHLKKKETKHKLTLFVKDYNGRTYLTKLQITPEQLCSLKHKDFEGKISEEEYMEYYLKGMEVHPILDHLKEHPFHDSHC